jgi:hypothetical protein
MNPSEMQATIEEIRREWHQLCMLATEPGSDPVHPDSVVERDDPPTTGRVTDADVETLIED